MKQIYYLMLGLVLGVAAGAIGALLLAPASGQELRASIRATADKDWHRAQAEWQAAVAKTNERLDKLQADRKQTLQGTQGEEAEGDAA